MNTSNKYHCECGKHISFKSLKSHLKTKVHKQNIIEKHEEKTKENDKIKFYIAKRTCPRNYDTLQGKSKNQEYLQIEGVPVIVLNKTEKTVLLNSLTSAYNRNFSISLEELKKDFDQAIIEDEKIVNCSKYPNPISLEEFDKRNEIDVFLSTIKKNFLKKVKSSRLKNFINDKIFQMVQSQGSSKALTLKEYNDFQNKKIKLSKHKRIGDPIFNRNSRWCPPVLEYYTYQDFQKSSSFPAPIGIRSKDFCLPSQLILTLKELFVQALSFKHVDEILVDEWGWRPAVRIDA